LQNGRSVADVLDLLPRTEGISERVHVGVRAHAGIAEEVPGPADLRARFEDDVALARTTRLQSVSGADAGESGSDDDDVEVFSERRQKRLRDASVAGSKSSSLCAGRKGIAKVREKAPAEVTVATRPGRMKASVPTQAKQRRFKLYHY
jgi:hypothetical protein